MENRTTTLTGATRWHEILCFAAVNGWTCAEDPEGTRQELFAMVLACARKRHGGEGLGFSSFVTGGGFNVEELATEAWLSLLAEKDLDPETVPRGWVLARAKQRMNRHLAAGMHNATQSREFEAGDFKSDRKTATKKREAAKVIKNELASQNAAYVAQWTAAPVETAVNEDPENEYRDFRRERNFKNLARAPRTPRGTRCKVKGQPGITNRKGYRYRTLTSAATYREAYYAGRLEECIRYDSQSILDSNREDNRKAVAARKKREQRAKAKKNQKK